MDASKSLLASGTGSQTDRASEETSAEHELRAQEGFPQVEQVLAIETGKARRPPLYPPLACLLGRANPLATQVDAKQDVVWLFDNTAYRPDRSSSSPKPSWQAEFVVAYFKRHTGHEFSSWVAFIADAAGFGAGTTDRSEVVTRISQRLQPMVARIRTGRFVNVKTFGERIQKLGPGGNSGLSSQVVTKLGHHREHQVARICPKLDGVAPHAPMLTHFLEPEGWLVISDVDDSIKITNTISPIGILVSTFVSDPTPVAGMPALYTHLHSILTRPAWFYLSASPYTLYQFLRSFLHTYFPPGTLILREASWQELSGYLQCLTMGTQAYKVSRIEKIHKWFPKRRVVCVGDSTQSDPEAYGEICRKWPGWVKGIYIRKVTDVGGMELKNEPSRFETAFQGIDRSIWTVFEDPNEVSQAVERIRHQR